MLVQVNTDRNIEMTQDLEARVESRVQEALDRFGDRITRVRVHFGDENSDKKTGPDDKRCMIEARFAGLDPVVGSDHAPQLDFALEGALEKVLRAAEKSIDRRRER